MSVDHVRKLENDLIQAQNRVRRLENGLHAIKELGSRAATLTDTGVYSYSLGRMVTIAEFALDETVLEEKYGKR